MTGEDGASEIQERYARGPEQRRKHETSREHLINESSRMYTFAMARACKVAIVLIDSKEDGRSRSETWDFRWRTLRATEERESEIVFVIWCIFQKKDGTSDN